MSGEGVQPLDEAQRESLTTQELAQAILDRSLRPRVGEIRRLAEAILEKPQDTAPKPKKPKKAKADGKAKKSGKKGKGKLAKIPKGKAAKA